MVNIPDIIPCSRLGSCFEVVVVYFLLRGIWQIESRGFIMTCCIVAKRYYFWWRQMHPLVVVVQDVIEDNVLL